MSELLDLILDWAAIISVFAMVFVFPPILVWCHIRDKREWEHLHERMDSIRSRAARDALREDVEELSRDAFSQGFGEGWNGFQHWAETREKVRWEPEWEKWRARRAADIDSACGIAARSEGGGA